MHEIAAAIVATMREPVLVLDRDLKVHAVNPAFHRLCDAGVGASVGQHLAEIGDGQWDTPELRDILEDVAGDREVVRDCRVECEFRGLGRRAMMLNARRLVDDPDGGRILLAISDVTESERLQDELRHQVKNVLANVQAMVAATLRRSRTLEEFETAFLPRLASMARTQDVMLRAASGRVRIRELLRAEVAAHGWTEDGRLRLDGPSVALSPREAQVLAMLLHELMTNAVKHGALAGPSGKVDVAWSTQERGPRTYLQLEWRESGTATEAPQGHKGFGSRLIEHSVRYSLGGTSSLDFTPDGVVWSASFPLGAESARQGWS